MAKQKVALECLSYHATASQDQTNSLATAPIKPATEYKLFSFKFVGELRENICWTTRVIAIVERDFFFKFIFRSSSHSLRCPPRAVILEREQICSRSCGNVKNDEEKTTQKFSKLPEPECHGGSLSLSTVKAPSPPRVLSTQAFQLEWKSKKKWKNRSKLRAMSIYST